MTRVLLTGFTHASLEGSSGRAKYQTGAGVVAGALMRLGYDLEWRPVNPENPVADIGQFDHVIMSIVSPGSISAKFCLPALTALADANPDKLTCIVDDWRALYPTTRSNFGTVGRHPEMWHRDYYTKRTGIWEARKDNGNRVAAGAKRVLSGAFDLMVPSFEWRDHEKFEEAVRIPHRRVIPFDHTAAFVFPPAEQPVRVRSRRWTVATLSDATVWLSKLKPEPAWPIDYHTTGWRMVVPREALPYMPQEQLLATYSETAAAFLPPYDKLLSSGWARERWLTIPERGCVVVADPRDIGQLRGPWTLGAGAVEAMTDDELLATAREQAREIRDWQWPQLRFDELIQKVVEAGAV